MTWWWPLIERGGPARGWSRQRGRAGARGVWPNATPIDTSRGGIVDEVALAEALCSGTIGSAVLDVFSVEPLEPEAAAVFEGLDNLVLTPHLAGNATEAVDRIASSIVESVLQRLTA